MANASALQEMAADEQNMDASNASPAASDGNPEQNMISAMQPVIQTLLGQNIPPDQIKGVINSYYSANTDGVSPAGLQSALMTLATPSAVQPAGQVAQADVTGSNPNPPASPPSQEPAPSLNPPSLPAEAQNAPQTPPRPDLPPVNGSAAPPAPAAATPAAAQVATPADPLDEIINNSAQKPAQKDSLDHVLDGTAAPDNAPTAPSGKSNTPWYLPQTSDMAYRFAEGLQQPLVGIGQAVANADSAVGITPASYAEGINKEVTQRDQNYEAQHPVNGVDWANVAGQVISPANALLPLEGIAKIGEGAGKVISPLLKVAKSALAGGTMAASQPVDTENGSSYAGGKVLQVGEGAAGAGALSAAGGTVASMIKPKISDDVQTLLDHNIRVGTDQMAGTGGSKLTSLPIVGGMITANHNRAVEDLNTAVLNKALDPIGEKLPTTVAQAGNDALAYTRSRLSSAYDDLLPTLSGNINDQTTNTLGQHLVTDAASPSVIGGAANPMNFQQKFSQLMNNKYYGMSLDTSNQLGKILTKEISGVVNNDGGFTGEQFKQMETGLNYQIGNYTGSPNPQDRMLGNALNDVKGLLKDQLTSSSPEGAQQLQNINKGYSIFKTAQRAASSTAAPNGVFNPAQLYAAVKNSDNSLDKRAFTEGTLPLYDLASAAKNVLSDFKNSGTADRGLMAAGAGALATGGASSLLAHPLATLAGAGGAAYYSQPGQALARTLMTVRPPGASALSDLVNSGADISKLSPYAH